MKQKEIEVFADPTYDATFKMLFGKQTNIELTKSFLNTMLNFTGTPNEINDLKIINSDLIQEDVKAIESAIDVRCKTVSGQDISIEMQRRGEDYFLARTQDYMAKILSSQVTKSDGGKSYNLSMDKTYMLVISKAKLFIKDNAVVGDTPIMYEKTIVPMIKELGVEVPSNKMNWKFFEIPKFKNYIKNKEVHADSNLKEQWLDFLLNCSKSEETPENRNEIIKRGYEIMKIANWTNEERNNYELSKLKEAYNKLEKEQVFEEGKLKGEIKGEIKQIKMGTKYKISDDSLEKDLTHTKSLFKKIKEYLEDGHFDDTESQIYEHYEKDLLGKRDDFSDTSDG